MKRADDGSAPAARCAGCVRGAAAVRHALLATFGGLALLLAGIGVHGVMSNLLPRESVTSGFSSL
jgi:hypothetical protein